MTVCLLGVFVDDGFNVLSSTPKVITHKYVLLPANYLSFNETTTWLQGIMIDFSSATKIIHDTDNLMNRGLNWRRKFWKWLLA